MVPDSMIGRAQKTSSLMSEGITDLDDSASGLNCTKNISRGPEKRLLLLNVELEERPGDVKGLICTLGELAVAVTIIRTVLEFELDETLFRGGVEERERFRWVVGQELVV